MEEPSQDPVADLLAEFLNARNSGKSVEIDSYLSRCPESRRHELREAISLISKAEPIESEALPVGFDLLGTLGQGAFGKVYLAKDRALGREVAVKITHPTQAVTPEARMQLIREARILASLDHPNIVRVFSVEEHEGGIRVTLERIQGQTLSQMVKKNGPLSALEAAQIGIELCRGLAALHAKGLIHRDIKPSNIMRDRGGRIVLLDFGLARSFTRTSDGLPGGLAGTPFVMAPEQFREGEVLTPATDIYSLGAVLYFLVTGNFPIEVNSFTRLREQVLGGHWTPLLDRRPDIPPGFAEIIAKTLSLDPRRRFSSAGGLSVAIQEFLSEGKRQPPSVRHWVANLSRKKIIALRLIAIAMLIPGVVMIVSSLTPATPPTITFSSVSPGDARLPIQFFLSRGGQEKQIASIPTINPRDTLTIRIPKGNKPFVYVISEGFNGYIHAVLLDPKTLDPQTDSYVVSLEYPAFERTVTNKEVSDELIVVVASKSPVSSAINLVSEIAKLPEEERRWTRLDPKVRGIFCQELLGGHVIIPVDGPDRGIPIPVPTTRLNDLVSGQYHGMPIDVGSGLEEDDFSVRRIQFQVEL